MKNTFTLLALTIITGSLVAQPTLQSADLPQPGFSATISIGPLVQPGTAGANQTWNYSAMPLTQAGSFNVLAPSATPFAAAFPGADLAYAFTLPQGTMYNYHDITATSMETLGDNITASGGDNYTPDPKTMFAFPFNFNQVVTDNWQMTDNSTGTVTRTYDGYGTLIMPFGTFNNVVRITSTNSANNTVFYNTNPIYPILLVETGDNMSIVFSNVVLDVNEASKETSMQLFPNPANDVLFILTDGKVGSCNAYNTAGQLITLQVNEDKTVDVSSLAPGLYIIQVTMEDGTVINERFMKK